MTLIELIEMKNLAKDLDQDVNVLKNLYLYVVKTIEHMEINV